MRKELSFVSPFTYAMQTTQNKIIDEQSMLENLGIYLPSQAPLNNFVHHNTLHAFQRFSFKEGVKLAGNKFGFRVYRNLESYRKAYQTGKISGNTLEKIILRYHTLEELPFIKEALLTQHFDDFPQAEVGRIRGQWKSLAHLNIEKEIHTSLFRIMGSFLDQGVSRVPFPFSPQKTLLTSIRELELKTPNCIFHSKEVRALLNNPKLNLSDLLYKLVGNKNLHEAYMEDALFAHPGWSGMVRFLEKNDHLLLKHRKASLYEFLLFQLLLELDVLYTKKGLDWKPLDQYPDFEAHKSTRSNENLYHVLHLWQEAVEFSCFDSVLFGLSAIKKQEKTNLSFQACFCIDDRECSLRRHLEHLDPNCETFGTPGYFQLPFYFLPFEAHNLIQMCPASISPKHVISEWKDSTVSDYDIHLSHKGKKGERKLWIPHISGYSAGLKLIKKVFFTRKVLDATQSEKDQYAKINFEVHDCPNESLKSKNLKWGFELSEQVDAVESLLKGMGMVEQFGELVYIVGHGASSVNNTHFAGYDCGACNGRNGSINARAIALMANKLEVRNFLQSRGISIPKNTRFVGAVHDTTRDEIVFFDLEQLTNAQRAAHENNAKIFHEALIKNAVERGRKFGFDKSRKAPSLIHEKIKLRSVSLFEPRPEWNHSNNALCIIGPRKHNKHLFYDRRAFLNSYDAHFDEDGSILSATLNAITNVCGGINLEYYFSSTDPSNLGAGSKLPQNVMGLIGVTNGIDGDLRTGLPEQMISIHNPMRLLVVVEQSPKKIQEILRKNPDIEKWYTGEWLFLFCKDPDLGTWHRWQNGTFEAYEPERLTLSTIQDWVPYVSRESEDLPVFYMEETQYA